MTSLLYTALENFLAGDKPNAWLADSNADLAVYVRKSERTFAPLRSRVRTLDIANFTGEMPPLGQIMDMIAECEAIARRAGLAALYLENVTPDELVLLAKGAGYQVDRPYLPGPPCLFKLLRSAS